MGVPLFALGWSAVTVYNVLVLAGFALSGLAMAIVVERWTGSRRAGIVAGLAYAFNAHTLVRFGHMQALHVQFLPLALDALHDLVDRPDWGAAPRLAAWCALQSLTSNYLLVMTALAMLVSAAAGAVGLDRSRRPAPRRRWRRRRARLRRGAAAVPAALLLRQRRSQGLVAPVRRGRALLGPVARLPGHRRAAALRGCGATGSSTARRRSFPGSRCWRWRSSRWPPATPGGRTAPAA